MFAASTTTKSRSQHHTSSEPIPERLAGPIHIQNRADRLVPIVYHGSNSTARDDDGIRGDGSAFESAVEGKCEKAHAQSDEEGAQEAKEAAVAGIECSVRIRDGECKSKSTSIQRFTADWNQESVPSQAITITDSAPDVEISEVEFDENDPAFAEYKHVLDRFKAEDKVRILRLSQELL